MRTAFLVNTYGQIPLTGDGKEGALYPDPTSEIVLKKNSLCQLIFLIFFKKCKDQVEKSTFSQFDSPGFSAYYLFYSVMTADGRVVDFYVATKDMVTASTFMGNF